MKTMFQTTLKSFAIVIVGFVVFVVLNNTVAQVGGMPQAFKNAYPESYFIKTGTFYPAIILFIVLILSHLLLNYIYLQKNIPCVPQVRGLLYGLAFGVLWFFGFLELIVVYDSDLLRHIGSGIRDLISLSVFGITTGMFFTVKALRPATKRETLAVTLYTAVFFAVFHGVQYYLTFPAIEPRLDDVAALSWLPATGAWIGVMYYYLSPKMNNPAGKVAFFAANTFGMNWLFYTAFYVLFLDIPLLDLVIRCAFDILGVALGLLLYEMLRRRPRP